MTRVLNGIFWVLRSGAPWRDLPETYGPRTTCYNRFVRWRQAGVWDQIMDALAAGHDVAVQMIDTSIVRVHQHGACIADNNHQDMGRSRGGLTSKMHAVVTAMACRSISRWRLARRMTTGCAQCSSALGEPSFASDDTALNLIGKLNRRFSSRQTIAAVSSSRWSLKWR